MLGCNEDGFSVTATSWPIRLDTTTGLAGDIRFPLMTNTSTDVGLADFLVEARAFLDANGTAKPAERKFVWGEGSDNISMFEERDPRAEREMLVAAQSFRRQRF